MPNKQEVLQKAFDASTKAGGLVHLNTEQANAFIDSIVDQSSLLQKARVVRMAKPNMEIARILDGGRFLHPGKIGSKLADEKKTEFGNKVIELQAKLLKGFFEITDEEISDNIEGKSLTDHIIGIITRKMANELEEIGTYARKRSGTADPLSAMDMFNGIKFRAIDGGHVVDATDTGNFSDRYVEKKKFTKLLKQLPVQYRRDALFLTGSDVVIDYEELYDTTPDQTVRTELKRQIARRPLVEIPLMSVSEPVATATATAVDGSVTANGTIATIAVDSATGITAGKFVALNLGTVLETIYEVESVSTNNVTFTTPLSYNVADGATVTVVTLDGADAVLTDPKNLIYGIFNSENAFEFEIERVAGVGYIYHYKVRLDFQIENDDALAILTSLAIR